jgi:hypothetical protein
MRTGPKLKGRQNPAPGGVRSLNQPDVSTQKLRGMAVPPTQGRTRNHPNTTSGSAMRIKPGSPVPNSFYANSRSDVHPKFNTKRKHD